MWSNWFVDLAVSVGCCHLPDWLTCCLPPRGTWVSPSSTWNLLGYEPNIFQQWDWLAHRALALALKCDEGRLSPTFYLLCWYPACPLRSAEVEVWTSANLQMGDNSANNGHVAAVKKSDHPSVGQCLVGWWLLDEIGWQGSLEKKMIYTNSCKDWGLGCSKDRCELSCRREIGFNNLLGCIWQYNGLAILDWMHTWLRTLGAWGSLRTLV